MPISANFPAPKKPKDDNENKNRSKRLRFILENGISRFVTYNPKLIHVTKEHRKLPWSYLDMKDVNVRITRRCLGRMSITEAMKYKQLKYKYIRPSKREHFKWKYRI